MPEVSVIIPSYNHAAFIGETIESILNQSYTDLELVIVDDASTDRSRDIIQKYLRQDRRIRFYEHKQNCGFSKTRNDAMHLASGKYISSCASDDVYCEDKLEKQLAVIKQPENENKVIIANGVHIDPKGNILCPIFRNDNHKRHGDIFDSLLKAGRLYLSVQTMLVKRENIGSIQFDERLKVYLNEYKFTVDLASRYHFYMMEEVLFKHRIHGNNLSCNWDPNIETAEKAIIAKDYLEPYKDRLSHHTHVYLRQVIIRDALNRGDIQEIRRYTLELMSMVPSMPLQIKEGLLHGRKYSDVKLSLDPNGGISFKLAEAGITPEDIMDVTNKCQDYPLLK